LHIIAIALAERGLEDSMEARKILALMASPRKGGNTDILTSSMLESARENGAIVEKVYLIDKAIKVCTQCEYCHQDAANRCGIDDDFNMIADKMIEADIIVFSTPIWWSSMHALLKLLLDRCYSLLDKDWANFKLRNKGCVVVACQTQDDLNLYVNPLVKEIGVYQEWLEFTLIDSLVASAEGKGDVVKNAGIMDKSIELGKRLASWQR
jgi:multimeric flavodoxin WrbA